MQSVSCSTAFLLFCCRRQEATIRGFLSTKFPRRLQTFRFIAYAATECCATKGLLMGLDIFHCERWALTLSTAGCSRLYISANGPKRPDTWEGRAACVACPVGAGHAGKPQNAVSALAEVLRMLCPRCGRQSARLIWGVLCASCDVRQREARARCNAKGSVPALAAMLHTQRLAVSSGASAPRIMTHRGVASVQEAIIHLSKSATAPSSYGRRGVHFGSVRQYEMPL